MRRIVVDHSDTDDVVQNTFVKVWQNFDRFRGEANIYTWIYRIAVNEALGFLRSNKNRFPSDKADEFELSKLYDCDEYFDADKAIKYLHMAIESLPPKQRAVFNMRYFDEMSYAEMSQIMDTSQGALKASYHHAQKKVEEFLNHCTLNAI